MDKVKDLDHEKLNAAIKYMQEEYGVTPENIDQKLEEVKEEFYRRMREVSQ